MVENRNLGGRIQNFFFKTLMSAVWENTNVIKMLNVKITLDPTAANVKRDFQEMADSIQKPLRIPVVTQKGLYMSPFLQLLHACSCAIYFIV